MLCYFGVSKHRLRDIQRLRRFGKWLLDAGKVLRDPTADIHLITFRNEGDAVLIDSELPYNNEFMANL